MIGNRLKTLREEHTLLQKELAKKLGLTQQTISLYESNKREPDIKTLKKIANFFEVSVDYLIENDSECLLEDNKELSPELKYLYVKITKSKDLQLLFQEIKDLNPIALKLVTKIAKIFNDKEFNTMLK